MEKSSYCYHLFTVNEIPCFLSLSIDEGKLGTDYDVQQFFEIIIKYDGDVLMKSDTCALKMERGAFLMNYGTRLKLVV